MGILLACGLCFGAVLAAGAPLVENPAAGAIGTRIVTLGTGAGPVARSDRTGSASLVQVGSRNYLIDAGPSVSQRIAKAGIRPADVRHVFLTHLHFDHVAGLASFLGYAWFGRTGDAVSLYGPPGTATFVRSALAYLALPEKIYAAQMPPGPSIVDMVRARDFDIRDRAVIYQDEYVTVTAVENSHYGTIAEDQRPFGAARSYSYRFDTPDRSIVFTGDTGASSAVADLAKGADILVAEVMDMDAVLTSMDLGSAHADGAYSVVDRMAREHLSPEAVGRLAESAGVKMVLLTHVGPGGDQERDMRRYTQTVRKFFPGPVVIASDGSEY